MEPGPGLSRQESHPEAQQKLFFSPKAEMRRLGGRLGRPWRGPSPWPRPAGGWTRARWSRRRAPTCGWRARRRRGATAMRWRRSSG